ncbi:MAG: diguanylate cyclase [Sphingomonas sp.]
MGETLRHFGKEEVAGYIPSGQELFEAVGAFLIAHRLSPDPVNYDFAYGVCSNPQGAIAQAVATLTDGGIRLTARDIFSLGGLASTAPVPAPRAGSENAAQLADGLVAQTQHQVEGFHDLVELIRAQTVDFGRDLEQSAKAMRNIGGKVDAGEFVRLTSAMLARVRVAENQLEEATQEAAELRTKLEEARDNARRDPLTGLPNRRAFEETYAERVNAGAKLCLAVCDIDHFKQVNDGFGHAVGDRVLKAIGDVLNKSCADHFVARYGGEEFVVLFSDIELAAAQSILEEARETVARKRYRLRETDAPLGEVTFSAGMVVAYPGECHDDSFKRADELLYVAKGNGRNCVKIG